MSTSNIIGAPEQLFVELLQTQVIVRKWVTEQLTPLGLTVAEYHALRFVQNHSNCTAKAMQTRFGSTAPTIAQLIANLEKKQLIKRIVTVDDKRVQTITLTQIGTQKVRQAQKILTSAVIALQLPAATINNTVALLQLIQSAISS